MIYIFLIWYPFDSNVLSFSSKTGCECLSNMRNWQNPNFFQIYDNVSHVNYGFQHEEQRPPPYAPPSGINPALPQYPGPQNPQYPYQNSHPPYVSERYSPAQSLHQYTPQAAPVNTHHTLTPEPYLDVNPVHKGI